MKKRLIFTVMMVIAVVMSFGACSPLRNQALKNTEGNSVLLESGADEVRNALLLTLAEKGFQIEPGSSDGVRAKKVIGDGSKTCVVRFDFYIFGLGKNATKLQASATDETSKTSSRLKWFLFIPYGTYATTAVVSHETIEEKDFYKAFFDEVKKNLAKTARK